MATKSAIVGRSRRLMVLSGLSAPLLAACAALFEPRNVPLEPSGIRSRDGAFEFYAQHARAGDDFGLALSGGGLRSAAFSLGVLSALAETGHLDRTSTISSVSGGGYASAWLFCQQLAAGRKSWGALARDGDAIEALRSNFRLAEFGDYVSAGVTLPFQLTLAAMGAGQPDSTLFAFNRRESFWSSVIYREALERLFLSVDGQSYASLSLGRLARFTARHELPEPVFNATVWSSRFAAAETMPLWDTVLEFGASAVGSLGWKFLSYDDERFVVLSEAVYLSAAAISQQNPDASPAMRNVVQAFALEQAWRVCFLDQTREPFPLTDDPPLTSAEISDGGFSENLGVFSLVRRGYRSILVVDAEYDESYRYTSYCNLQQRLHDECGLELSIEAIDSRLEATKASASIESKTEHTRAMFHVGAAKGTLRSSRGEASSGDVLANVWYVKLAFDPDCTDPDVNGIREYSVQHRRFPQQPTSDIDYSTDQFDAYFDLGRAQVRRSQLADVFRSDASANAHN